MAEHGRSPLHGPSLQCSSKRTSALEALRPLRLTAAADAAGWGLTSRGQALL